MFIGVDFSVKKIGYHIVKRRESGFVNFYAKYFLYNPQNINLS